MILFYLLQSLTTPTTEQAVRSAVSNEAAKWYAPFIGALVAAGVGLIAGVAALVMAWLATAKAKLRTVEAKAEAELEKVKADAATAEAKAKAEAAAAAVNGLREDVNVRMSNVSATVNQAQATAAKAMLYTMPPTAQLPSEPPKGPTP